MLEENYSRLWASVLIDECRKNNLTAFFSSPGLRNAPFLAAFAQLETQKPGAIFHRSVVDERSAAFMALGHIKATGKPAAVVCTSGTALANYFPAVIEAYHSQLPLVVISADRPFEWVEANANQSIKQTDFFSKYAVQVLNLERLHSQHQVAEIRQLLHWKLERLTTATPGPFHLNVPFAEPLDWQPESITAELLPQARQSFAWDDKAPQLTMAKFDDASFGQQLAAFERPLVLVGELPVWLDKSKLRQCLSTLECPKYLDVASNLKYHFNLSQNTIPGFDHPEVIEKVKAYRPDLILHLGGPFVSKFIYQFLKTQAQARIVHLSWSPEMENPGLMALERLQVSREWFESDAVFALSSIASTHEKNICAQFESFVARKRQEIEIAPMVFPRLSKDLIENARPETLFYLGNSTTIRSFDSYASLDQKFSLGTVCHRGVSGIEGFVSAAHGLALAMQKNSDHRPLCLVLGDLSAMHDLNAFIGLKDLKRNLTVVLVNNQCGGIFNLLPAGKEAQLSPYLTTPHDLQFAPLLRQLGLEVHELTHMQDFATHFTQAQEKNSVVVLECKIDENENQKIYQKLKTICL